MEEHQIQHTIEDPSLFGSSSRNSKTILKAGRYHRYRLEKNNQGVFLTLLDHSGKILCFVAGALRRRVGQGVSEMLLMTPEDLSPAIQGGHQAAYRTMETTNGPQVVYFREVPYVTRVLANTYPEAVAWGSLVVSPADGRTWANGKYLGANREYYIRPGNLAVDDQKGQIAGSGGKSLSGRLYGGSANIGATAESPACAFTKALEISTAWRMAISAVEMFGGMAQEGIPTHALGASETARQFFSEELSNRRAYRDEMRDGRRVNNHATPESVYVAPPKPQVTDLLSPESVQAMEATTTPEPVTDEATTATPEPVTDEATIAPVPVAETPEPTAPEPEVVEEKVGGSERALTEVEAMTQNYDLHQTVELKVDGDISWPHGEPEGVVLQRTTPDSSSFFIWVRKDLEGGAEAQQVIGDMVAGWLQNTYGAHSVFDAALPAMEPAASVKATASKEAEVKVDEAVAASTT